MIEALSETGWKLAQIIVWLIVGTAWFFGDSNAMKERVAVLESRIDQEMKGYAVFQAGTSQRMERLETVLNDRLNTVDRKLDCLVNRSMCR